MAEMQDMATALGRTLGQTPEYQALDRAMKGADADRDMVELKNEIQQQEGALQMAMTQGRQPTKEEVEQYESTLLRLQGLASYQAVVAAQANFEKVMHRVNEAIQAGMVEGAASRIIIPT